MKKKNFLSYLLSMLAIASMIFVTSCGDDEEETVVAQLPTISLLANDTLVSVNNTEIEAGSSFYVGVSALANATSKEKLTTLSASLTFAGVEGKQEVALGSVDNTQQVIEFTAPSTAGDAVVKISVTDKDGESASVSLTIKVVAASTDDLSADATLTWQRVGSAAGTGLSAYGLKWTANVAKSEYFAKIVKDSATKLVELPAGSYALATTKAQVKAAIDFATDLAEYKKVSTNASNSALNLELGVISGGEYFIIKLNSSTVASSTNGTTITINGVSKN